MPDVYPGDLTNRIRQLEKDIEDLKAQGRPAATEASLGWRLKTMSIPTVPAGEAHIGADASGIFAADVNGTKRMMYKASHVNTIAAAAGDTYTTGTRDLINLLVTRFNDLITALVGAQHMDP